MNEVTPDLGKTYPVGHPSGRVWESPVSVEQARARVPHEMDHLEDNYRIGLDTPYAMRCLAEVLDDYYTIVLGELWTPLVAARSAVIRSARTTSTASAPTRLSLRVWQPAGGSA